MDLVSDSFEPGGVIPDEFAFGAPDEQSHVAFAPNRNPHLGWVEIPDGTLSFAVTCIDADSPTVGDDVNVEGRSVPADLERADFVHWLLVDLPPDLHGIAPGEFSDGVTPHGKKPGSAPYGATEGLNDYTGWFAGDTEMDGRYHGYDGPCPPWNDSIVHRYTFTVLALDVASVGLEPGFGRTDLDAALAGHVLARASLTGTHTLTPNLRQLSR